jgi:RNA polymerase sigma-70 factor (ECF subfamily)
MSTASPGRAGRALLERSFAELRPKLHRYLARMTGSVIDGEDVVQEALAKAFEAIADGADIANVEAWLFRIAHNAGLDFLRRRARQEAVRSGEDPDMIADPRDAAAERIAAAAALHSFMRLPVARRSTVVLRDVLGYSLEEVAGILGMSLAAVKAALHRGRVQLREAASQPDERPLPRIEPAERALLAAYIDRFNARDFDAIRDMLADEVRLDLVNRTRMRGRQEVSGYLSRYAQAQDWRLRAGFVEGRPAIVASDVDDPLGKATYFMLLDWKEGRVLTIRDFRHARYAIEGADIEALD